MSKKKNKDMFEVFFRKKPSMILIGLKNNNMKNKYNYGSILAKQADCTYSHAVKILQEMEKVKLVSFEKQGRIKKITLTENGQKMADYLERCKILLE